MRKSQTQTSVAILDTRQGQYIYFSSTQEKTLIQKELEVQERNGEIVDSCLTLNTKIRVMTLNFLTAEKEETQCLKKYLGMTKEN